jgi:hypothetical protein
MNQRITTGLTGASVGAAVGGTGVGGGGLVGSIGAVGGAVVGRSVAGGRGGLVGVAVSGDTSRVTVLQASVPASKRLNPHIRMKDRRLRINDSPPRVQSDHGCICARSASSHFWAMRS